MINRQAVFNTLFCLFFLVKIVSCPLFGQALSPDKEIEKKEIATLEPVAVPVVSPEEAEVANQEAITIHDMRIKVVDEWRQNNNSLFLKRMTFLFLIAIPISIIGCFLLKEISKKDFVKAIIALCCTAVLLLFLFSAMPFFYNFWGTGNLLMACVVWCLIFKRYGILFSFSKKDIILIPLLLLGTWLLFCYLNPRMRDIPNTIVLNAETTEELIYNGTVTNDKKLRPRADFLAHYKYIELNEGWRQTGSYRAFLEKGNGRLTLYLPTELIQKYKLGIKLTSSVAGAKGTLSINGSKETPWQMNSTECVLSLNDEQHLYLEKNNCPIFFLLLCLSGGFLSLWFALRITERLYSLYFSDKQKALELALLTICILYYLANLKNAFFIDNCSDLDGMASNVTKHFSTKHPPIIYVWWLFCRFISPFESINTSYVFGNLICFWGGVWLIGAMLIRKKTPIYAFLLILPCINLISASMFSVILVDQIVVSTCILTIGLTSKLLFCSKYTKIVLMIVIPVLILVSASVRLEGLSYAIPLSIVFASFTMFKLKKGVRRVMFSGIVGCLIAFSLFSIYRYGLSRYVFHATETKNAAIDNILREALGVCYFSQDWDDLPNFFSDDAKNALDRTCFVERPRPYRMKYLPNVSMKQIQGFWLHMVKKHPLAYFRVKWVGNQVLWRCRTPYVLPYSIKTDNDPTATGLSFHDFFKEGIISCGLILPAWLLQVSLLFVFVFVGILLFQFADGELWIIWGIGASGFLHNLAFFLISGAPNYRYIFWADISGGVSFILSILVIQKLLEYKQKKKTLCNTNNPDNIPENSNEALCPNTLFQ